MAWGEYVRQKTKTTDFLVFGRGRPRSNCTDWGRWLLEGTVSVCPRRIPSQRNWTTFIGESSRRMGNGNRGNHGTSDSSDEVETCFLNKLRQRKQRWRKPGLFLMGVTEKSLSHLRRLDKPFAADGYLVVVKSSETKLIYWTEI